MMMRLHRFHYEEFGDSRTVDEIIELPKEILEIRLYDDSGRLQLEVNCRPREFTCDKPRDTERLSVGSDGVPLGFFVGVT